MPVESKGTKSALDQSVAAPRLAMNSTTTHYDPLRPTTSNLAARTAVSGAFPSMGRPVTGHPSFSGPCAKNWGSSIWVCVRTKVTNTLQAKAKAGLLGRGTGDWGRDLLFH